MEKEKLILNSEIDGEPIRYSVRVTPEIAKRYTQIRKEQPKLTEPGAMQKAQNAS